MKKGIYLIILIFLYIIVPFQNMSLAKEKEDFPWTAYFGTQDKKTSWAKTIRGVGRGIIGVALLKSGRIDMGEGSEFHRLEEQLKILTKTHDIIIPVGGLGSGRDREKVSAFMDMIKQDNGRLWKDVVYKQAVRIAKLPNSDERIYWQIGNEVNSRHFSQTLRSYAAKPARPHPDDSFTIPYYVEYFLAPTVEALRSASRDVFNNEKKIQIVLGTIAGAYRYNSQKWLNDLLSYKVRGDFAKSLAGKHVFDLIDIIAIHYLVTQDDETWMTTLDKLRTKWIGQGRIKGIWATEELGKKRATAGMGAATTIKVTARYLHWWNLRNTGHEQGRCIFWGWQLGDPWNTGAEGMQTLYNFLGDTPLKEIEDIIVYTPPNKLESYAFQSINNPSKRVIFIFPKNRNEKGSLKQLTLKASGWTGSTNATMHIFSASEHKVIPMLVERNENIYNFLLREKFTLENQAVAIIFLQQK